MLMLFVVWSDNLAVDLHCEARVFFCMNINVSTRFMDVILIYIGFIIMYIYFSCLIPDYVNKYLDHIKIFIYLKLLGKFNNVRELTTSMVRTIND